MSGRIKLCLLPSPHLSLCNSSEAGLPYNFSAPVSHMAFPCPLQYWKIMSSQRVAEKESCSVSLLPYQPSCRRNGFTPLKGFFGCHLLCTPGNSHHHLIMSSSGIAQWIGVGGVWYTVGDWISENIHIQIFLVSAYIIRIASCCLVPVQ